MSKRLIGARIKGIYKEAEKMAELHQTLTSRRGDYFRKRLLHKLGTSLTTREIEKLRVKAGIREYQRHLNKLMKFKLVEQKRKRPERYVRTDLGLVAVNAIRALERGIGREGAQKVYEASLGPNSIRLFLRIYGQKKEIDMKKLEIKYSPAEIGRLSLFLPRSIEGVAAIEKLADAGLLVHKEDDNFYVNAKKARNFYQYLLALYGILLNV